jgi:hypothetical protein
LSQWFQHHLSQWVPLQQVRVEEWVDLAVEEEEKRAG